MKLKTKYEFVEIGDEITAVPVGDHSFTGVLIINETMRDVMKLLEKETSEDAVISTIYERYNAERNTVTEDVHGILQQLAKDKFIS